MHKLEGMYRITYDSWQGYYVVHTLKGEVWFHKDKQGLPYLNLEESSEAAVMLLQREQDPDVAEKQFGHEEETVLVETTTRGTPNVKC